MGGDVCVEWFSDALDEGDGGALHLGRIQRTRDLLPEADRAVGRHDRLGERQSQQRRANHRCVKRR